MKMHKPAGKTVRIIGVPTDLGQSLRGVDMGPSALRYAGLSNHLRDLGYRVEDIGNIYVPVVNQSRIVRISADGSMVETIATLADGLDFPASLAFGTGKGERQGLFASNYSLGPPIFAGPGLVKLDVGVPGMPLP